MASFCLVTVLPTCVLRLPYLVLKDSLVEVVGLIKLNLTKLFHCYEIFPKNNQILEVT